MTGSSSAVETQHHHEDPAHIFASSKPRLIAAASLNTGFAVVQVLVGVAIGSVVVLADATHQIVDALGLLTALAAVALAARPPSPEMSFGWGKADALGGFVSGLLLLGSVGWIAFESIRRLFDPVDVSGGSVIVIGVIAIVVNGVSVIVLSHGGHAHHNLSMRAARLHLLTDLAGSFIVVAAGLILAGTDATWIDPAASLLLCALVLRSTWTLMGSASAELLDRSPTDVTVDAVVASLSDQPGVDKVHHVHVRPLGQRRSSVTAHVVVDGSQTLHEAQSQIGALTNVLERDLGVAHATIQLECHPCDTDDC